MIRHTLQPLLGVFACLLLVGGLLAFSPTTPQSPEPSSVIGLQSPAEDRKLTTGDSPDTKALWGMPSEAQKAEGRRRTDLMSGCIRNWHPLRRCLGWQQVPAAQLTEAVVGQVPPAE